MAVKKGLITNYFKPTIYVRFIKDINIGQLKRQGIKLFIADLDNTLVPHYTRLPNKDVLDLITKVREAGMDFAIMSNNITSRVRMFGEKANVNWYASARKPFKKTARQVMKDFNVVSSEIVMVGDQIVMDILVANRMKWESVLVQPLVSTDYKMSKFNMFLENRIYKNLEKKNILRRGEFDKGKLGETFNLL